jgi:hypothetical protein
VNIVYLFFFQPFFNALVILNTITGTPFEMGQMTPKPNSMLARATANF